MSEPRIWKEITPHAWKSDRPIARLAGRAICINCGLMRLKNSLTEWAVAKGCDYLDHPSYRSACNTLPPAWRDQGANP